MGVLPLFCFLHEYRFVTTVLKVLKNKCVIFFLFPNLIFKKINLLPFLLQEFCWFLFVSVLFFSFIFKKMMFWQFCYKSYIFIYFSPFFLIFCGMILWFDFWDKVLKNKGVIFFLISFFKKIIFCHFFYKSYDFVVWFLRQPNDSAEGVEE